jgi:Carboxypeptidase regulatory-like domain
MGDVVFVRVKESRKTRKRGNDMKRWEKAAAVAMAALLFVSTTVFTAMEAGAALKEVKQVVIQQGALRGVVVNSQGKGLVKAVVDVRDSKGDVAALGITKADGSFSLAAVPEGEYLLTVNGEFTYSLHVAKDVEAKYLSLAVPSQVAYSAGVEGESLTPAQLVLLGGGFLGVALILSDSNEDCK